MRSYSSEVSQFSLDSLSVSQAQDFCHVLIYPLRSPEPKVWVTPVSDMIAVCHKLECVITKFYATGGLQYSKKMGMGLIAEVSEAVVGCPELLLPDCCVGFYTEWKWFSRIQLLHSIIFIMLILVQTREQPACQLDCITDSFSYEFFSTELLYFI